MADNNEVFVFIGTYGNLDDAQWDYAAVKDLHSRGVIGTYDAAVIDKDTQGNVHVSKHEKPTQHGAWTGIAAGAVVGVLFPPAIIAGAAVGGAAGGIIGHVYHGMSRQDMKDFGETLTRGQRPWLSSANPSCQTRLPRPPPRRKRRSRSS